MMMIYLSTFLIRKIYRQTSRPCTKTKKNGGEGTISVREEEEEEGERKGRRKED